MKYGSFSSLAVIALVARPAMQVSATSTLIWLLPILLIILAGGLFWWAYRQWQHIPNQGPVYWWGYQVTEGTLPARREAAPAVSMAKRRDAPPPQAIEAPVARPMPTPLAGGSVVPPVVEPATEPEATPAGAALQREREVSPPTGLPGEPVAAQPVAPAATPAESPPEPRQAREDVNDLQMIEGIGPKIAAVLRDAGIGTFAALATTPVSRLRQVLDSAGLKIIDPQSWPEQARLAATGHWDELEQLKRRLNAGRKV